jgi:DNA-binding transcriptional MerR regulator
MKMRELETRTGVHRETIRVYLRHKLIPQPSRPHPNVADYDESHVKAIAAVRDLQKGSALTITQIREALHGEGGAPRMDSTAFQHLEALVATRVGIDVQPILLNSLSRAYPHACKDAEILSEIGVVDILDSPDGPRLSITDARIVTIWSEMRQAGFSEENGFTPDILSFYIRPAEIVAENEATIFLDRVGGKISEDSAATMLQVGLRQMQDFWGLIRLKRFMSYIHQDEAAVPSRGAKAVKAAKPSARKAPAKRAQRAGAKSA